MKKLILTILLLSTMASFGQLSQDDEQYRVVCKRLDQYVAELGSMGWVISYDTFTSPLARARAMLVFYQVYLDTVKYDVSLKIIADIEYKINYLRYAITFLEKYKPRKQPFRNY